MIIDCHGHLSAPAELWAYRARLTAHRGSHGRGRVDVSDEEIIAALEKKEMAPEGHLGCLRRVGTSVQMISPRPFQMMHSESPATIVHWWTEECNNLIARQTQLFPGRFFGIAGLPQVAGAPILDCLPELERCVNRLGFRGCLLNPDPFENGGMTAPPMGDPYWYPLYEKLCELDVPAHIHPTASRNPEREPYTLHFINEETTAVFGLLNSTVFDDFPSLKIIVSHGGGAIPYQIGRFQASSARAPRGMRFVDRMRNLYFDTVLYSKEALDLLLKVVGPERCLFGAECPGVGSVIDVDTGRTFDDIAPHIHSIEWLSHTEKEMIFHGAAMSLFKLDMSAALRELA